MPAKNKPNLGLADNQNAAIFDDFCRRRLVRTECTGEGTFGIKRGNISVLAGYFAIISLITLLILESYEPFVGVFQENFTKKLPRIFPDNRI